MNRQSSIDNLNKNILKIFKENGISNYEFCGPISFFDGTSEMLGVWFEVLEKWAFVPFASPWSAWGEKEVDKQIAEWIDKDPLYVEKWKIYYPGFDRKFSKKCECGASHTSNKNCHSHWCPKYRK